MFRPKFPWSIKETQFVTRTKQQEQVKLLVGETSSSAAMETGNCKEERYLLLHFPHVHIIVSLEGEAATTNCSPY